MANGSTLMCNFERIPNYNEILFERNKIAYHNKILALSYINIKVVPLAGNEAYSIQTNPLSMNGEVRSFKLSFR